jgi:hypothetical protein
VKRRAVNICLTIALLLIAVLFVSPLCSKARPRHYKAQTELRMRNLLWAILEYHEANGNQWPDELDFVEEYLGGFELREMIHNSITGDIPGFEYVKPTGNSDPATTVILYQLRDGRRDTSLSVGYADGSVREVPRRD